MAQLLNLASALEMLGGEKNLLKELLTDFACGKQFKKEELVRLEQMEDITLRELPARLERNSLQPQPRSWKTHSAEEKMATLKH